MARKTRSLVCLPSHIRTRNEEGDTIASLFRDLRIQLSSQSNDSASLCNQVYILGTPPSHFQTCRDVLQLLKLFVSELVSSPSSSLN